MHPRPAQDNKIQYEPDAVQTEDNSTMRNFHSPQNNHNLKTIDDKRQERFKMAKDGSSPEKCHQKDELRSHLVGRALSQFNKKRCRLFKNLTYGSETDAQRLPATGDVKLKTLHLFRYATFRERSAILIGIGCMWYAASWQPISVFILATMAALMGHYTKRTSWATAELNRTASSSHLNWLALPWFVDNSRDRDYLQSTSSDLLPQPETQEEVASNYDNFNLMGPLQSFLGQLFDLGSGGNETLEITGLDNATISKVHVAETIFDRESREFLRESFEINGCAFFLALTQLFAFFLGTTLITWAARRQASHIKLLYYKSCLTQELSWFEGVDSGGGGGSSLNALVDKYEDGVGMKLALLCYFLGHVALFTLTAFYQLAQMATFCMPFVLLVGLIIYYLSEWQAVAIGEQSVFGKRSLQLAEEILAAIRTVFTFNGQHKELARYSASLAPFYRRSIIRHLYTALNTSISKFSIFACFACYCFYARRLFPPHSAEAPSNQAAVLAVMRGAEVSIVNILISIPFMEALQQARGSIARIYAAIERRSRISDYKHQLEQNKRARANKRPDRCEPSISFRSVQFSYTAGIGKCSDATPAVAVAPTKDRQPTDADAKLTSQPTNGLNGQQTQPSSANTCTVGRNRRKRVLNQFSLDIEAGQSIAFVGPSGSGKSTVLALIQRLYDIDAGQLLIGGKYDIRELSVAWLRNQIAFVSQEPSLFDMSIEENIRLGLGSDPVTGDDASDNHQPERVRQQVLTAARAAGAHEFISRLPEGYATRVGSAGVQLSGGQKQRIAIARALIREPKILLLDEPTSALDTESEAQVQEALRVASAGRTTITVAHRLSTVQDADLIVVLGDGKVVEKGTHEDLMSRSDSLYQKLYAEQQHQISADEGEENLSSDDEEEEDEEESASNSLINSEHENADLTQKPEEVQQEIKPKSADAELNLSFTKFWRFCEVPRWGSLASAAVCLLAGLILPFHLIAHSYLFAAFAFDEPEDIGHRLNSFGLLILSCSGVVFVVSFLEIILPGYVGEQIALRLRSKTMDALLQKPMFYFDMKTNSAGSLCDRFNGHICALQSIAGARMATMLEALATLTVGAIYGCGQNLRLSLFCLAFALLVLLTTIIESRIVQLESSLQQKFDTQLAHLMADSLSNMRTIASLNKERFFTNKFAQIIRQREIGVGRPLLWLRTFLTSLKFVMPAMSWSASMYYGCHLLVQGSIDLQTIFIICPVVLFAVNDTFRALVFLPELLKARKSLESLYRMNTEYRQLNDTQSTTFTGIRINNKSQQQQQARGQISFENVHFAYPSRPSARVLDGLSLRVEPGQSVALVGASGSGKSSCVNLLEKLYEYQAGEIKLDNRELSELDTNWLRLQIGLVSQEPTLLSYTIGDNIRYGDNSRIVSLNEVIEAAKTANIHDFIMSLPDKYDTQLLGSNHTAGCQLSGGQRQRLAIARALVRRAPILIFDEATSALDAHNEAQVQEALDRARVGRTSLTIAHRLACVRQADKIAVLSEGRLVELGKHEELMELANGHYKRLWKRQHQYAKKAIIKLKQ